MKGEIYDLLCRVTEKSFRIPETDIDRRDLMNITSAYREKFGTVHPISDASCQFLISALEYFKPDSILDAGSGLSSLIFSMYYKGELLTIDHSPEWLEASKNYIVDYLGETKGTFKTLDEYLLDPTPKDLVFYDLGYTDEHRMKYLSDFLLANRDAVFILDDLHKRRYRRYVKATVNDSDFEYFTARKQTLDSQGRYMGLLVPRKCEKAG